MYVTSSSSLLVVNKKNGTFVMTLKIIKQQGERGGEEDTEWDCDARGRTAGSGGTLHYGVIHEQDVRSLSY